MFFKKAQEAQVVRELDEMGWASALEAEPPCMWGMANLSFCIDVLKQLIFQGACRSTELAQANVSTVPHDVCAKADDWFAVKCDVANVSQANIVVCVHD